MTGRPSRPRSAPAAAPGPDIHTDLVARARAILPTLSPAQSRIVRIIESDPAAVATLTVDRLAEQAATSAATVVRAARSLGFEGYPQLRLALAAHGGVVHSGNVVPLGADIADGDPAGVVLAKLAAFESEQIQATAQLVDPTALERVVALVRTARRIDVYGIGASGVVAQDLTRKMSRIGLDCRAHADHDAAMVSACLLGPLDVAIGISHSGKNPGTVKALALARKVGAATVAITGAPRSPLARQGEHVLATAGREFGLRSAAMASRTGQLLVVDAIFIGIARSMPGALSALQRIYDALSSGPGRARSPRSRRSPRSPRSPRRTPPA